MRFAHSLSYQHQHIPQSTYIFTLVRLKACRQDMHAYIYSGKRTKQMDDTNEAHNQWYNAYSIRFINGLLLKLGQTK